MSGPIVASTPVLVGGTVVAGGVVVQPRTGGAVAQRLDDLLDVAGFDDAPTDVALQLRKGVDDVVRPEPVPAPPAPPRVSYPHVQAVAASVWPIPHGLGYHPNVTAYDTDGGIVEFEGIAHPTNDLCEITFGGGLLVAGTANAS